LTAIQNFPSPIEWQGNRVLRSISDIAGEIGVYVVGTMMKWATAHRAACGSNLLLFVNQVKCLVQSVTDERKYDGEGKDFVVSGHLIS